MPDDIKPLRPLSPEAIKHKLRKPHQRRHPQRLTQRQVEVLELYVEGLTTPQVAARLGLTRSTVKCHNARIRDKLDTHSILQSVVAYVEMKASAK